MRHKNSESSDGFYHRFETFEELLQLPDDIVQILLDMSKGSSGHECDGSICELMALRWMSYEWATGRVYKPFAVLNFEHRMLVFAGREYKDPHNFVEPMNMLEHVGRDASFNMDYAARVSDGALEEIRDKELARRAAEQAKIEARRVARQADRAARKALRGLFVRGCIAVSAAVRLRPITTFSTFSTLMTIPVTPLLGWRIKVGYKAAPLDNALPFLPCWKEEKPFQDFKKRFLDNGLERIGVEGGLPRMVYDDNGVSHLGSSIKRYHNRMEFRFNVYVDVSNDEHLREDTPGARNFWRTRFIYVVPTKKYTLLRTRHDSMRNNYVTYACLLFEYIGVHKEKLSLRKYFDRYEEFEETDLGRLLNHNVFQQIAHEGVKLVKEEFSAPICMLMSLRWMSYEWLKQVYRPHALLNFEHRMRVYAERDYYDPRKFVDPMNVDEHVMGTKEIDPISWIKVRESTELLRQIADDHYAKQAAAKEAAKAAALA
eukprot:3678563-Rhodomonas_salina.1